MLQPHSKQEMTLWTLRYVHLVAEVVLAARVSSVYTVTMSVTKWQHKFRYCGQGQDSLKFAAQL